MPNQDYLTVIRETEEKAEAMIAAAHAESRLAMEAARTEAARLVTAARAEAEALHQQMLQAAGVQSEAQSSAQIAAAEVEAQQICTAAEPLMADAVRAVAERIVK